MKLERLGKQKIFLGTPPENSREINELKKNNIKTVISLLHPTDDLGSWKTPENLHIELEKRGHKIIWVPTRSKRAPSVKNTLKLIRIIEEKKKRGSILIICGGAWGRAASLATAYLVYRGKDPKKAIRFIRRQAKLCGEKALTSKWQRGLPEKIAKIVDKKRIF